MPRDDLIKMFYSTHTDQEKLEYIDTTINPLIREYMDSDKINKRKHYQNEIKRIIKIRDNFTGIPYEDLITQAIINNVPFERVRINNNGKFYGEVISPIKTKATNNAKFYDEATSSIKTNIKKRRPKFRSK